MTVAELNGWEPATVTFDGDGNVLTVTVREPRFTPRQKAILLASRREESVARNDYGIPISEAMDPANQFRFKVVGPRTDWAALAVHREQEHYRKANKDADMTALRWGVEKI